MTIWILALLFLASLAGLGYRQGAIRVGFSFLGIVLGAWLAGPLGHLLKPLVAAMGVKNPALLWIVPPCVIFAILLTLAKVAGLFVHKKADVYFKYKAGDLRLALFERLNQRVGLCLGSLNATAYVVLLTQGIYMISYWTVQASSEADPWSIRLINRAGKDLEKTGMSSVAGAVDGNPHAFYDAADIAGLLYQTPLLEARLSRYPGILGLAERAEFQELASDTQFAEMRQRGASIVEVLNYPRIQTMMSNPDLLKTIESSLVPNLKDLRGFLETGESPKFSEKILGRWNFDLAGTVGLLRRERPNLPSAKMAEYRRFISASFSKATVVATPEQKVFLKNVPPLRAAAGGGGSGLQTVLGEWNGGEGKYTLTLTLDGRPETAYGVIQGSRLTIAGPGIMAMAFNRED